MSASLQPLFAHFEINDAAKMQDICDVLTRAGISPDMPQHAVTPPRGQPQPQLMMFNPAIIKTDPAAFQFRNDCDTKSGVMKSHHRPAKYSSLLHGDPLVVFETLPRNEGEKPEIFVVDGHHRLSDLQYFRTRGEGPEKIAAYVLREADGYTKEDAKIIAAYRNISHSHATAVEAAKVFKAAYSGRVHTDMLPSLDSFNWENPKFNMKFQHSFKMKDLSDEALEIVEKEKIPAAIAAKVVDQVSDASQHAPVMRAIGEKLGFVAREEQRRACAAMSRGPSVA